MKQILSQKRQATRIFVAIALLLLVLILVAVLIYTLPSDYTRFDGTDNPVHEISATSHNFVASLEEDVTVYWLCPDGIPNETMSYFLINYVDASEHLSLVMVNTTTHPDFTEKYTSEPLNDYSMIVESGKRYRIIRESELYYFVNEFVNSQMGGTYRLTEAQYSVLLEDFEEEMSKTETTPYFCGEAYLTAAIDYVTRPYIAHPYVLTGHGDHTMSPTLLQMWGMYGLTPEELSLKEASSIPEDASFILLFAPTEDLSDKEALLLKQYIQGGGSFLLVSGPDTSGFTNLASICALFGMHPTDGIVVDTSKEAHISNQINLLVPMIYPQHAITYTAYSNGLPAYIPNAMAIAIDEKLPDGVSASVLFASTTAGYRVSEDSAMTPLCPPSSQYITACATMQTETADGTANPAYFAWFASSDAFTDTAAALSQGGNYQYLLAAAAWMHADEQFSSPYANLNSVDISEPVLEELTSTSAMILGLATTIVLPICLIVIGLAIWLKRRTR